MKITKKHNHDSIWLKVTNGKEWAKLSISRGGMRVRYTKEMQEIGRKIFDLYRVAQDGKLTYGQTLDYVESCLACD